MNKTIRKPLTALPQRSWRPMTIVIGISVLLVLSISGLRLYEVFALFEPKTTAGQVLAVAMALCIETGAALAAYRLAQLRRREQPIPVILIWALALLVAAPIVANFAHVLRHTGGDAAGSGGTSLFWQIVLGALLSLAFPITLVLAAEVLPEHIRTIDEENATLRRFCEEVQRRLVRVEAEKAARGQFQEEVRLQLGEIGRLVKALSEQVRAASGRAAEDRLAGQIGSDHPASTPDESVSRWELLWREAGGKPFDTDLIQEVFERGKSTAYNLLSQACETGLIEKIRPGLYRFVAQSEGAVQAWVEQQEEEPSSG